MNRSILTGAITLGAIFLISAIIFVVLRVILGWDEVTTKDLLTNLTKFSIILAVTILIGVVLYVAYSYYQALKQHVPKLLVIGHQQPESTLISTIIKQRFSGMGLEAVSVPADFIGDIMPKTKWQLKQLRGSWFLPAPRLLITFNVSHLQALGIVDIQKYLHDIQLLVKDLTPWKKRPQISVVVHNMNAFKGFDSFQTYALDGSDLWTLESSYSFSSELSYFLHEALHRLTQIPHADFMSLLRFNQDAEINLAVVDEVFDRINFLALRPQFTMLVK